MTTVKIGVLAFQGAFAEHDYSLRRALDSVKTKWNQEGISDISLKTVAVRKVQDITDLDGIILPGGESTTMSKFLERNNFKEALDNWMKGSNGVKPLVWGTCAGLILLSNHVQDMKSGGQLTIGGLDVTTDRNSYGRQNESFEAEISLINDSLDPERENRSYKGIFIRAPGIVSVDNDEVEILAQLELNGDKRPVAVQQSNLIVTSFHPELTDDLLWHSYFITRVLKNKLLSHSS